MKLVNLSLFTLSAALTPDHPCCDPSVDQATCDAAAEVTPPRCPKMDRDYGYYGSDETGECPEFCLQKPNDYSCCGPEKRGNRGPLLPHGALAGDIMNKDRSLGASMAPIPFKISNYLGKPVTHVGLSSHGYIRLSNNADQAQMYDYYNYYKYLSKEALHPYGMIAPFWGDNDCGQGGEFGYRIVDTQQGLKELFKGSGYHTPKKDVIDKVLVATWSNMIPTAYDYQTATNKRNTFQVVLATAANSDNFRISFNYGDIEQDTFQYTGGDVCGETSEFFATIGLAGEAGIWQHPYSNTDKANEVDDTSNTKVTGRIMMNLRGGVDVHANDVELEPIVPGIEIATNNGGLTDVMISAIKNKQVFNHGCHCSAIGNPQAENTGGSNSVDAVDELCKQWKALRSCLGKINGACYGDKNQAYNIMPDFKHCVHQGECCKAQTCTVDAYMIERINEMTFKTKWTGDKDRSQCVHVQGYGHDSCCGVAPYLNSFDSAERFCKDGVLV